MSNAHCLPGVEQVGQEVEEKQENRFLTQSDKQPGGERMQATSGSKMATTWGRESQGGPSGVQSAK